jgi:hypothetical protein
MKALGYIWESTRVHTGKHSGTYGKAIRYIWESTRVGRGMLKHISTCRYVGRKIGRPVYIGHRAQMNREESKK